MHGLLFVSFALVMISSMYICTWFWRLINIVPLIHLYLFVLHMFHDGRCLHHVLFKSFMPLIFLLLLNLSNCNFRFWWHFELALGSMWIQDQLKDFIGFGIGLAVGHEGRSRCCEVLLGLVWIVWFRGEGQWETQHIFKRF